MMNDYPLFKYIPGNSLIHQMNSKLKMLWYLITIFGLCFINNYYNLSLVFLYLFVILLLSKIKIKNYVYNTLLLWPLYIIVFCISYFITYNFDFSIILTFKIVLFVILFLIITFTTSLSEISWGFECLFEKLKKIKIPVSKISLFIAFIIKFISTLFEQGRNIRKSLAYRGVSYNNKITAFNKMLIPTIRLSLKLSKRMLYAMKLRFYGSSANRTNYHGYKATKFNKFLIFLSIMLVFIIIYLGEYHAIFN